MKTYPCTPFSINFSINSLSASCHRAEDTEVSTYNILVKKTGPLSLTWNGVGVIQVPKVGKEDKESNNLCKTVLIQRKEQILAEVGHQNTSSSCPPCSDY